MDTKLLVSTALVTPQSSRQSSFANSGGATPKTGNLLSPATVTALGNVPRVDAAEPSTASEAALRSSAPNSALTTYRDQDSGRLIVRVYDRESGDVVVEFPPEKAFRPIERVPPSALPGRKATVIA